MPREIGGKPAHRRPRPQGPLRFYVSGRRAALEAISAGRARELAVVASARSHVEEVRAAAEAAGVPIRTVDRGTFAALGREGDAVAARVDLPPELSEGDLARRSYSEDSIVVVLDGITDPQNLGAAARSAEAAGAALLITREHRSAPVTPAAVRASSGALLHLPHARVANIPRALGRLQDLKFTVVGLDEDARSTIYDGAAPEGRIALVVGAEDRGLSRLVRERCDALRSLPMRGRVASLNASAALSAALFAFVLPSRSATSGR
jgi:23S rRNA (guanosine2251-2'-O)-methyltransferase